MSSNIETSVYLLSGNMGVIEDMIEYMTYFTKEYNIKIVGGCCGTNDVFIEILSEKLTGNAILNVVATISSNLMKCSSL